MTDSLQARIISGRLWLAFALLPVANLLFGYALLFPIFWWLRNHSSGRLVDPASEALAIGILCGVLALLVTICGGIPVLFWLRRRGPITLQQTLAAGVFLGNTPLATYGFASLVFALMHLLAGTLSEHLASPAELVLATVRVVLLGSVLGLASALVVWVLGIRNTALVR